MVPLMHFVKGEQCVFERDQDLCSSNICGGCMRYRIRSLLALKISKQIYNLNVTCFTWISIPYPIRKYKPAKINGQVIMIMKIFRIAATNDLNSWATLICPKIWWALVLTFRCLRKKTPQKLSIKDKIILGGTIPLLNPLQTTMKGISGDSPTSIT